MALGSQIKKLLEALQKLITSFRTSKVGMTLRNKYILTALLFLVWLLLFDQNNLTERKKMSREYNQLLEEREYYQKKIEEDRKRIEELKTDNDNLEKFAREQYLMKKDNEDIFVIVDEE
jgi:cell division protein DivIC